MTTNLFLCGLTLALLVGDEPSAAQSPPTRKADPSAAAKARRDRLPAFTLEREAAALSFVKLHHSELHAVLDALKTSSRESYEDAIRELFQVSETLSEQRHRDQRRYELALAHWKTKSRLDLAAARFAQTKDPELGAEVKRLIRQQLEGQLAQQKFERDQVRARLDNLEANCRRLEAELDKSAEARFAKVAGIKAKRATKKDDALVGKNPKSEKSATPVGKAYLGNPTAKKPVGNDRPKDRQSD